jgi:hypothetical protein
MPIHKVDEHARDIHKQMLAEGRYPSCYNCEHCAINTPGQPKDGPTCVLYQATPPVEVIVLGCPDWAIDIPF